VHHKETKQYYAIKITIHSKLIDQEVDLMKLMDGTPGFLSFVDYLKIIRLIL
jgi:hypothetical protein